MSELAKMEQRANIKFCFKLGKTATETWQMLQQVYRDEALSRSSVFEWYKRFQQGRESLEDDEHTGRPRSGRSPEDIMKVSDILKKDRCVSTRLLEDMTGISKSTIHRILTEDLNKRKVCAKFVPHSLNDDQKPARVEHSKDVMATADSNQNFLKSLVTCDETWCFQYEPLTQRQSSVWKGPTSPKPKKVRLQKWRIKTMLVTFFDADGIIHQEFIPEGTTVTGRGYLEVLKRFMARVRRVRPQYRQQGSWSFLHDNAPAHTSIIVREFLASRGVVVLNHPPYSPDLSPCDYYMFPKLKLHLKGTRFDGIPDIQAAATDYLTHMAKTDFQKCFDDYYIRCNKCVESKGDYFE